VSNNKWRRWMQFAYRWACGSSKLAWFKGQRPIGACIHHVNLVTPAMALRWRQHYKHRSCCGSPAALLCSCSCSESLRPRPVCPTGLALWVASDGFDIPLVIWDLYVDSDQNATGQVWYWLNEAADFESDGNVMIWEEWWRGNRVVCSLHRMAWHRVEMSSVLLLLLLLLLFIIHYSLFIIHYYYTTAKSKTAKQRSLAKHRLSSFAPQSQKNDPYLAYERSWSRWQTRAHTVQTPTPSTILHVWQWYQCWFINSFWVTVYVQSLLFSDSSSCITASETIKYLHDTGVVYQWSVKTQTCVLP